MAILLRESGLKSAYISLHANGAGERTRGGKDFFASRGTIALTAYPGTTSIDGNSRDLLRLIEQGDQSAVEAFVRRYEAEIRRAVRVRLTDPRLRRVLDSADVCQSVFANFFVRVSLGEYDLDHPADIAALLIAMARNKLLDQVRHLQARKRDQRRVAGDDDALGQAPAAADGPSQIAARNDLLEEVRKRMTDDERQLAELRGGGWEWPEIAARIGGSPDALRKKFTRAMDRIAGELGLSEFRG